MGPGMAVPYANAFFYQYVNVGPEHVTILVQTEKETITSDWKVLEPERRADGKVLYRYTTAIDVNETAAALAVRAPTERLETGLLAFTGALPP